MAGFYLAKMKESSEQMARDQEKIDKLTQETDTIAAESIAIFAEVQKSLEKLRKS